MKYSSTHRNDFLIIRTRFFLITQKIELYFISIHMSVIIHKHSLNTSSIHITDRM